MISMARFWLAILLMLLQMASPLIHAHKNDTFEHSFHLPEFEKISSLLDKTMMFVPVTNNDQVVTVGAGIKNDKRRLLSNNNLNAFVTSPFFVVSMLDYLTRQCFTQIPPINHFHFFNLAAPRAPPIFLFR